jgi:hypothetical protein
MGNDVVVNSQHTTDPYQPQVPGIFYATFDGDAAAPGTSAHIRVLVEDNMNGYSKTLTYVAYKFATGVVNVTKSDDEVVIYPNPAKANVNVIFDASMGVKNIAIYNLIGKAVSVYKVNGNSAKLDLTEIPSGIYFVRLINSQGKIVATRKITHQ